MSEHILSEINASKEKLKSLLVNTRETKTTVDFLEQELITDKQIGVGISANISIDLLSLFLRKYALLDGCKLNIENGNHNDPINDLEIFRAAKTNAIINVNFLDNIQPGLESKIELIGQEELDSVAADFLTRIELLCKKTKSVSDLYITSLHLFHKSQHSKYESKLSNYVQSLNNSLLGLSQKYKNVHLIDTEGIISDLGAEACYDRRFYFQNTAPYKPKFLDALAYKVWVASRGFNSNFYKALILDCDNTLWGGIIGEDFLDGIKLNKFNYPGNIFWRAQNTFASLEKKGVIICLASKNNLSDVDKVLDDHPDQVLKNNLITLKSINWENKVDNIVEIAKRLNIGLDACVFLDDSDFECENVRSQLPQVKTFQVPKILSEYPKVLKSIEDLFIQENFDASNLSKTEQYRQIFQANESMKKFDSHDDYLSSLNISIQMKKDEVSAIDRISELTLKTNQFNLTSLRQTQGEIEDKMNKETFTIYSFIVSDKFGSAGLTVVVIAEFLNDEIIIQAFLMSCRILGRGVEQAVFASILKDAQARGYVWMSCKYIPSEKNQQVANFYDGFALSSYQDESQTKSYKEKIINIKCDCPNYIEVK